MKRQSLAKVEQCMAALRSLIIVLFTGAVTSTACADAVKGIHSRVIQPVALRGGVLMLPLAAERPGDQWPGTVELTFSNSAIIATVAWVYAVPPRFERHWTDDPRSLAIRPIQPADDTATIEFDGVLGPFLLARIPANADGDLRLGKQVLHPIWKTVTPGDPLRPDQAPDANRQTLELSPRPDRPDPVSPFEYWRWVLLADALDLIPPTPFGGDIERMAAEHYAGLWRIGMARLAGMSRRIAEQCRELLTRTCIDRRTPFAAWVSDPVQIGSLLSRLIDFQRNDVNALSDAVAWIDEQAPLLVWPESEAGEQVMLNVVTPRPEPLAIQCDWRGGAKRSISLQIEPGVLMRVLKDRMPLPKAPAIGLPAPAEPASQILQIESDGRKLDIAFGPRKTIAKPPGVFFRPFTPPLTLYEVQTRRQQRAPDNRTTLAQVRKLGGRWEVFFECRRPNPQASAAPVDQNVMDGLRSLEDLRGVEAVTLVLGPQAEDSSGSANPAIWITVPENGFHRVVRGTQDGTLQVHKKSHADRWYCRIVLPANWCPIDPATPLLAGCLRSHADCDQLESGPNTTAPWRAVPARAAIDLSQWDDLPRSE